MNPPVGFLFEEARLGGIEDNDKKPCDRGTTLAPSRWNI
jgi:hypothetical protein